MAQQQVAGSIILDQLRDRIVTGLFLGSWQPGERLPSIRDVAGVESVDRKTAAAAYRRLQEEGLVRVRARSGVYLREEPKSAAPGPLERLYRRWLENVYEGARELGLDTRTIISLLESVAEVEESRVPVVENDWTQAEAMAHELRDRAGIRAVPYLVDEVRNDPGIERSAPFLITTPYHRAALQRMTRLPVVETTLARSSLRDLRKWARDGAVLVVVPSTLVASRLERALEQGQLVPSGAEGNVRIRPVGGRDDLLGDAASARCAFLWPGVASWVADVLRDMECVQPAQFLSDESLTRVRRAVLDAALQRHAEEARSGTAAAPSAGSPAVASRPLIVSSTSGDGAPGRTVAADL
jgi:GntR family transcriptional regulator